MLHTLIQLYSLHNRALVQYINRSELQGHTPLVELGQAHLQLLEHQAYRGGYLSKVINFKNTNTMKKQNAPFGKLSKWNFWKGLLIAFSSGSIGVIYETLTNLQDLSKINYNLALSAGVLAAVGYLQVKLFSGKNGVPYKKD